MSSNTQRIDLNLARRKIVEFISKKVEEAGGDGAVIGLSGGIDSTVTAYLTVQALGSRRVLGLIMPDSRVTPETDVKDAKAVANELGIKFKLIDIAPIHSSFMKYLERNRIAEGNLRARIRMSLLYYHANLNNMLVVGTGDRSELLLGYFCYDEVTRAVTDEGLKYFYQLKKGDAVYSVDFSTQKIVKGRVEKVFTFHYRGNMLSFSSESVALSVTPNHRMVAKGGEDYAFRRAEEFERTSGLISIPFLKDENSILKNNLRKPELMEVREADVSHEYYSGTVWCPSISRFQNLLVERNGRLNFSGNTKYGDGGVDLLPIADLYKEEVRAMADILGVSRSIIQKKSSPRLWEKHTAEDELGLPYSKIDRILAAYFDNALPVEEAARIARTDVDTVMRLLDRNKASEHKRQLPAICKIRE